MNSDSLRDIVTVISCFLFIIFCAIGPVFGDESGVDFILNRSICGQDVSCSIDCGIVKNTLLWIHTVHRAPSLDPAAAIEIASAFVLSAFGDSANSYVESLSLMRCGEGWVYVVRLSVNTYCSDLKGTEFGVLAVGIFMDGTVFFPSDCAEANSTPLATCETRELSSLASCLESKE
jgi:hypothetical protein